MKKLLYVILLILVPSLAFCATDTTFVTTGKAVLLSGRQISVFSDVTGNIPFEKIITLSTFSSTNNAIPNMGTTNAAIWLKFGIFNETDQSHILLNLNQTDLNHVRLYYPINSDKSYTYIESGNLIPISSHKYQVANNVFSIPLAPYTFSTIYMRVQSKGQIVLPIYVGTEDKIIEHIKSNEFVFGIYLGIILIMLFYNFFIYLSVKDISYLYYILFILFVGFAQVCLDGYGYKFIWSSVPFITLQSINWSGALSAIASIIFVRVFLVTKENLPLVDKILIGYVIIDCISVILTLIGFYNIGYVLIDIIAFIGSFTLWSIGANLAFKGHRSAKYFLIAWSFFLLSVIIFVMKDFGVIPYNFFTNNILLIGSSIEIALLSFALADKINVYKKEKEISQVQAIKALKEKEEFANQQNVILERKVNERTDQLRQTNNNLELTLKQLQESQSQLVDAEKMASLGQLTAGIAHEINNPINFVKSNVKPLQMDIDDIKDLIRRYEEVHAGNFDEKIREINAFREEIDFEYVMEEIKNLLSGIEDGATRTAEIVKGLRTFSRLDESDLKEADIQDGLDTTLMLLNHTIPKDLAVIKNYQNIPKIECYPGKLNQVFMNILTNSIQALRSDNEGKEKKITLATERLDENVIIRIADTGPGIPKEVQDKIFEPFFTTKEVGEGTGLGLSIVYSIIEKHHGKITVHSEEKKGTEFVITLPLRQSEFLKTNTAAATSVSDEPLNR